MTRRPPSLRREIVAGYSVLLLVALTLFAGLAYALLRRSLSTAGTQSLRQTAYTAEQIIAPAGIPRVAVEEERLPPAEGAVETLRRRTHLATGDVLEIYVARTGDVEERTLRSFAFIALVLIPLTTLAAAFAGRSVADRLLKPLNRLVEASREIGIAGLARRVEEPDHPAELRELAQALNGMLERLDRAVRALRSFTADASHELRTPLTAIRGTAEVALARPRSGEELRQTLEEVLDETGAMLRLVEDLLTLARGEEGALPRYEEVDLTALLQDVHDMASTLAAERPVEVWLQAPEGLAVTGDPGALRRLFLNLASNAVKFTERGTVTIAARPLAPAREPAAGEEGPAAEGSEGVEVSVADTGYGIAAEALPRVFDRFYRADAARERSGGTGLGLAIARMIVVQHGGTLTAESVRGVGSKFTVRLPG
jgi:heavy metal sensor kinase